MIKVDLWMQLAIAFIALIMLMSEKISDPAPIATAEIMVDAAWDKEQDKDIDIHIRNPQGQICTYKSASIGGMILEEDDTGHDDQNEYTQRNFERMKIITLMDGEYIINIHGYRCVEPEEVSVRVTDKEGNIVFLGARTLTHRQQDTVIILTIKDGKIIDKNFDYVPFFEEE